MSVKIWAWHDSESVCRRVYPLCVCSAHVCVPLCVCAVQMCVLLCVCVFCAHVCVSVCECVCVWLCVCVVVLQLYLLSGLCSEKPFLNSLDLHLTLHTTQMLTSCTTPNSALIYVC